MSLIPRASGAALLSTALCLAAPAQGAESDALKSSISVQESIDKDAGKSQRKIDAVAEETQRLLEDYKFTLRKTESLRIYDDQLEKLVRSQEAEVASLERQLGEIEDTNRGVVPLLLRMIDTLDRFVELDVPFLPDERRTRVAHLRELMDRADVTTSEKYRRVMEAYQIETEYGRTIEAYRAPLATADGERSVDFLRLGRVALMYQSLDGKEIGIWNAANGAWEPLPAEYRRPITTGLRIARKQAAPDLIKLPIPAPEVAR